MKQIVIIFYILSAQFILAQTDSLQTKSPKIGLVLSGGGAKGLAHIGVIKEIEKTGLKIDYIGGTSMGAIIGALYASGYTGNQLDSIFKDTNFDTLISDEIPRNTKTFFEKEDADKYALTFPFDNFKLKFPSAISKGQNIYNLLSKLLFHVKDIDNFNELPIPFLCVATNVEKGNPVVFNSGYLPRAITASGALPTLFSPVIIDETIYVDGGVLNNYPVDEVKAMGADIIIGVDVQDSLRTREKLTTALDVLVQVNNYRTIENMVVKKEKTTFYINPNIDDFSVVSFNEGTKIVEAGALATAPYIEAFKELALNQQKNNKPNNKINNLKQFYIDEVIINGNKKYTRSYILGKLKLKTPSLVTYETFSQGVNNLSATGNFYEIDYNFIDTPKKNHYKLFLNIIENKSTTSLRLAAHYDNLYKSAALVNITQKRLLTNNDIASLDLIVGDNLRYDFEYYIDKGFNWSIGVSSRLLYFEKNVGLSFLEEELEVPNNFQLNRISLEFEDITNQLLFQTVFQRVFQLGLGAEHKYILNKSETIGIDQDNRPGTVFENSNFYSAFGILNYDTLDDRFFPTNGFIFNGTFNWYLFANSTTKNFEPFSIAKAKMGYAIKILPQLSSFITTEGGLKIGSNNTNALDFFLGGFGYRPTNNFVEFYGYDALDIRGNTYLKTALDLDFEFIKKNHLIFSANIANAGNNLFENATWIDGIDYTGYAIGYSLETFLGPLEIKYSYSPEIKENQLQISAGFRF